MLATDLISFYRSSDSDTEPDEDCQAELQEQNIRILFEAKVNNCVKIKNIQDDLNEFVAQIQSSTVSEYFKQNFPHLKKALHKNVTTNVTRD